MKKQLTTILASLSFAFGTAQGLTKEQFPQPLPKNFDKHQSLAYADFNNDNQYEYLMIEYDSLSTSTGKLYMQQIDGNQLLGPKKVIYEWLIFRGLKAKTSFKNDPRYPNFYLYTTWSKDSILELPYLNNGAGEFLPGEKRFLHGKLEDVVTFK